MSNTDSFRVPSCHFSDCDSLNYDSLNYDSVDYGSLGYYSFNAYLKKHYHEKLYKLSLNGGFTCPNRDGTLDMRGCIFCSAKGSGDFAESADYSISKQIEAGKKRLSPKHKGRYIGYFQAFTNTYAPVSRLRHLYMQAVSHPDIALISIATRPDCIDHKIISLLLEINEIKPVWIELGLQTVNERSAQFIRRGYPLHVFDNCVEQLHKAGIPVITHVILGLPHETTYDMCQTISHVNALPVQGIKLQNLHILEDTDLSIYYKKHPFPVFSLEEYCRLLAILVNGLRHDIVIHRLTGDGPKKLLIAPKWSGNKKVVLNTIHKYFREHQVRQGSRLLSPQNYTKQ